MFQVFNMGTRLEFYVEDEATALEIINISKSFNIDAQIIGTVIENKNTESIVTVSHLGEVYHY